MGWLRKQSYYIYSFPKLNYFEKMQSVLSRTILGIVPTNLVKTSIYVCDLQEFVCILQKFILQNFLH